MTVKSFCVKLKGRFSNENLETCSVTDNGSSRRKGVINRCVDLEFEKVLLLGLIFYISVLIAPGKLSCPSSSFIIFYLSSTPDEDYVSKVLVFLIVLYVWLYR